MKVKLQLFPFSDVDVFKRIISKDWTGGSCMVHEKGDKGGMTNTKSY